MATLGIPHEYEAFIVNSRTQQTLAVIPWSMIKWQRCYREISGCTVTVPQADGGLECASSIIGGLRGWSQMIRIERNGSTVWDGPLMGWSRQRGSRDATFRAADRSKIMQKRLIRVYRKFTNVTPYSVIRQVMVDGLISLVGFDPYPVILATATPPDEQVTREYFVERLERVYDVVTELCDNTSTGFYTCALDTVYLDELTIADMLGRAGSGKSPVLSELTTVGLPGIDVNCEGQANVVYAGGAGQGTNGFPLIASSANGIFFPFTLEKSATEDRSVTDLALVVGRAAAECLAPATTLEQLQLSPDFGSEFLRDDLANLLPGAQFDIDFAETVAFNVPVSEYREVAGVPGVAYQYAITKARLEQLDVTVQRAEGGGITEEFLASYRPFITAVPTGTQGAIPTPDVSAPVIPNAQEGAYSPPAGVPVDFGYNPYPRRRG